MSEELERYTLALAKAYLDLGKLTSQLNEALKQRAYYESIALKKTERLIDAESILSDDLQLEWCDVCRRYTNTDYEVTIHRGQFQQEEGIYFCECCRRERD